MAADKFLQVNTAGNVVEGRGVSVASGAGDEGKYPALDAAGKLVSGHMPDGVGSDTLVAPASEDLVAGDLVCQFNDSGTLKIRKADSTVAGKEAKGFVKVGVSTSASATMYLSGSNAYRTGMTLGAEQFLHTVAGGVTETAPVASGNVVQILGIANSTTSFTFAPEIRCVRA